MNCLDCEHADACHSELKRDLAIVNEAVRGLNKGHMMEAIESMELIQRRLEARMTERTGR